VQPLFLSLEEVLEIHRQQIEYYGGASGVRDLSLLESAIAQPQATYSDEFLHTSLPAMAAAYLFHICRNHPCRRWEQARGGEHGDYLLIDQRLGADFQRRRAGGHGARRAGIFNDKGGPRTVL
jgi:hypothetical protein